MAFAPGQGRPSKFPTAQAKILAAARHGMPRRRIAALGGVTPETLYAWLRDFSDFSDALEKAEAEGELARVRRIEAAGRAGEWQADAWWLERRYPGEWGKREHIEHSGSVNVRHLVQQVQTALDAALPDDPAVRERVADALLALDERVEGSR